MANIKLNAKNLKCPMPIIEIAKSMKTMKIGDVLEIEATDPVFKPDIEAWCRKTKNELVKFEETNECKIALIKKCA